MILLSTIFKKDKEPEDITVFSVIYFQNTVNYVLFDTEPLLLSLLMRIQFNYK